MKGSISYSKIEASKYKNAKVLLIYFLFALFNIMLNSVIIYKSGEDRLLLFIALNSFLFLQVLFLPILIAVITSKSVEIEEQGNMLGIILSSGISLYKIYNAKLFYILKSFTIYSSALWIIIILQVSLLHIRLDYMPKRLLFMYVSFLVISYFIIIVHYNIAIITQKHLLNLSLALLGSLIGVISMFFMKRPIIPYSWFSVLSAINYVNTYNNSFRIDVRGIVLYPLIVSLLLGFTSYIVGKKMFLRRNYD